MADCGDIWHADEVKALGGVHTTVEMATLYICNLKILFTPITSEQKQKWQPSKGFVILWITLFLRLQSCVAVRDRRIRRRRLSYDDLHQCCLPPTQEPWITVSIAFLVVTVLVLPPF